MRTEAEIKARRAELERELEELDDEEQEFNSLTPDQQLAEALHKVLCHYNHTDMCGWFYGSWKAPRDEHRRYVEKAHQVRAALPGFSDESILAVVEVIKR